MHIVLKALNLVYMFEEGRRVFFSRKKGANFFTKKIQGLTLLSLGGAIWPPLVNIAPEQKFGPGLWHFNSNLVMDVFGKFCGISMIR